MKKTILISLLFVLFLTAMSQGTLVVANKGKQTVSLMSLKAGTEQSTLVIVPNGSIQVDGFVSKAEWDHEPVSKQSMFQVFFAADSEWFYVGVFSKKPTSHFTDLYIHSKNTLVNLNASMQLGERQLPIGAKWDDNSPEWIWGNNDRWNANVVDFVIGAKETDPFSKQVKEYYGQEFRTSKAKLGQQLLLFVQIRDFVDEKINVTFPAQASKAKTTNWHRIVLNGS